ncbi:protein transport protein SEC23 D-like [Physcomitrium patens]
MEIEEEGGRKKDEENRRVGIGIVRASLDEGVKEARALLHDWLVILTAQYNYYCKLAQFEQPSTHSRLDVAFSGCPQLQALPRLIFALLRNQLLRSHEEGVHPDHRIYLQCLFSALEPSFLLRAVYPVLSSFETLDRRAYPRHSLSRAALMVNGSPIYVLDAFTTLIVYYSPTADPALPFPPPQNCGLRSMINKLKQERNITPKLLMIRGGRDNTEAFDRYLIEEQEVDGSGIGTGVGFVSFLDDIAHDVMKYMK